MPHFFFDTQVGDDFTEDLDGTELTDRHVVFAEARRLLLDITRELQTTQEPFRIEISVREAGRGAVHWHALLLEARWLDGDPLANE
jgi:hypothetical protein